MSTYRSLDVKLPSECAATICWSRTPKLKGATLMELLRYYDELTSSSNSDVSAMLMEGFTTTLSAVEWVEDDSSRPTPGFLTCDAAVWYTTRISGSYTALLNSRGTMSGRTGTSSVRISDGRIVKWSPLVNGRKLRGMDASMHRLKIK